MESPESANDVTTEIGPEERALLQLDLPPFVRPLRHPSAFAVTLESPPAASCSPQDWRDAGQSLKSLKAV